MNEAKGSETGNRLGDEEEQKNKKKDMFKCQGKGEELMPFNCDLSSVGSEVTGHRKKDEGMI